MSSLKTFISTFHTTSCLAVDTSFGLFLEADVGGGGGGGVDHLNHSRFPFETVSSSDVSPWGFFFGWRMAKVLCCTVRSMQRTKHLEHVPYAEHYQLNMPSNHIFFHCVFSWWEKKNKKKKSIRLKIYRNDSSGLNVFFFWTSSCLHHVVVTRRLRTGGTFNVEFLLSVNILMIHGHGQGRTNATKIHQRRILLCS